MNTKLEGTEIEPAAAETEEQRQATPGDGDLSADDHADGEGRGVTERERMQEALAGRTLLPGNQMSHHLAVAVALRVDAIRRLQFSEVVQVAIVYEQRGLTSQERVKVTEVFRPADGGEASMPEGYTSRVEFIEYLERPAQRLAAPACVKFVGFVEPADAVPVHTPTSCPFCNRPQNAFIV